MSRVGPVRVLEARPSETDLIGFPDGRIFQDADVVLPSEQVEQIRQGYRCLRCFEPQSVPFPEICESVLPDGQTRWCNYPIREKQAKEFPSKYGGEETLRDRNLEINDRVEQLGEFDEYESRTGLIIPDHIRYRP